MDQKVRCFLACWPARNIGEHLHDLSGVAQKHSGGRRVALQNIHLTLAFLGDLMPTQRAAVEACCPPMERPLVLTLDRLGYWRQGGILWAGSRTPDPDFVDFAENVRAALRRVGFRLDSRPFVPHLTLLRKARRRPRVKIDPVDWPVTAYSLVASELTPAGANYSTRKRWSTPGDVK